MSMRNIGTVLLYIGEFWFSLYIVQEVKWFWTVVLVAILVVIFLNAKNRIKTPLQTNSSHRENVLISFIIPIAIGMTFTTQMILIGITIILIIVTVILNVEMNSQLKGVKRLAEEDVLAQDLTRYTRLVKWTYAGFGITIIISNLCILLGIFHQ